MKFRTQRIYQQGIEALRAGRSEPAERCFREVLKDNPAEESAILYLGMILAKTNRMVEAAAFYEAGLQLIPGSAELCYNLALARQHQGDVATAIHHYEMAIRLRPTYAAAWNNLGLAYNDPEKGIPCFQRAMALDPGDPQYHDNLGTDLVMLGHRDEGIRCYQEALRLRPNDPDIRLHYGLAVLGQGHWQQGWPFYDGRIAGRSSPLDSSISAWKGESLKDRSILLWAEQGYGDSLMMFRYANLLSEQGATVSVLVQSALMVLFQRGHDRIRILPMANGQRPEGSFDFHCPLMSLPHRLGLEPDLIQIVDRYLFARPVPRPSSFQAKRLQIGLAWFGNPLFFNDRQRSLSHFRILAPLLGVPGCQFHSLSVGSRVNEINGFPVDNPITNAWDFDDTAAYIQHLDLVISVDTAAAHLAGALGKPVWILLPTPAEWRWYPYGESTPWYSSAR
ncbi:MAG: tetratricopeptide repeat protein, partial [bacterium]